MQPEGLGFQEHGFHRRLLAGYSSESPGVSWIDNGRSCIDEVFNSDVFVADVFNADES